MYAIRSYYGLGVGRLDEEDNVITSYSIHYTKLYDNLVQAGDALPYGVVLERPTVRRCWDELDQQVDLAGRRAAVDEYNRQHEHSKRGLAVTPVCFGISFAQTALNQAGALVNIYVDGSVSVSTGAVEMGQGVNSKIRIVAARTLGISYNFV